MNEVITLAQRVDLYVKASYFMSMFANFTKIGLFGPEARS